MNPVIEFLQQRGSTPAAQLVDPAPNADELNACFQASASAPDHGGLMPWRFEVINAEQRHRFADILEAALLERDPEATEQACSRERKRALRAPMIIMVIACLDDSHPKIPLIEQQITAGCAALQCMQALQSCGYGAVWLTGTRVYHPSLTRRLGLAEHEQIIGLINTGTAQTPTATKPRRTVDVRFWESM